jgi:hypothetical protein
VTPFPAIKSFQIVLFALDSPWALPQPRKKLTMPTPKKNPRGIAVPKPGYSPKPARRAAALRQKSVGGTHTPTGQPAAHRKKHRKKHRRIPKRKAGRVRR